MTSATGAATIGEARPHIARRAFFAPRFILRGYRYPVARHAVVQCNGTGAQARAFLGELIPSITTAQPLPKGQKPTPGTLTVTSAPTQQGGMATNASFTAAKQLITTKGGAYCYLPSITALTYLSTMPG